LEAKARQRLGEYNAQMQLEEGELRRFSSIFSKFGLESENERRAGLLVRRGQSEMFAGHVENAALMFRRARELAPQSSYVLAMNASFELARMETDLARQFADEACRRADRRTGALAYSVEAQIRDALRDRPGRIRALAKALEFDPTDVVLRHQYGVALSLAGDTEGAIEQFSLIIAEEEKRSTPRETLLIALKTRIINLRRIGDRTRAAQDLERAKELVARYRHLQGQASQIAELEEGHGPDSS